MTKQRKIRNQALHDSLLQYSQVALKVLSKRLAQGVTFPAIPETVWDFQDQNADILVGRTRDRPCWPIFFVQSRSILEPLAEYKTCLRLFREDATIGKQVDTLVGSASSRMRVDAQHLLDRIVASSIDMTYDHLIFHQDLFETEYELLEEAFHSPVIAFDAIAPLQGFKLDKNLVTLEDQLRVEKLTIEEIRACIRMGLIHTGPTEYAIFNPPSFAVKLRYYQQKIVGDIKLETNELQKTMMTEGEIQEHLGKVVAALRLFKVGNFWMNGTIHRPINWLLEFTKGGGGGYSPYHWFGNYFLTDLETEKFQAFLKTLVTSEVKSREFLDVAIRRFDFAYERFRPHDKIIDLMVAAEALFLSDLKDYEYRGELSFRLALRAGFFIGSSPSERREIYDLFREAYRVRSAIVHGGEPELPKGSSSLDEFVNRISNSLRTALHKAILLAGRSDTPKFLVDWANLLFSVEDDQGIDVPKCNEKPPKLGLP